MTSRTKPAPTLTRSELAEVLPCHRASIARWEREGLPATVRGTRGRPSRFSELEVRAWLAAREAAAKNGGTLNPIEARAKKDHWQGELNQQQHRIRAGELLPAVDVAKVWNAERDAVRTAILATYTTQADKVHRVAVLEGVAGVERILREVAHEILRELSRGELAAPSTKPRRPPGSRAGAKKKAAARKPKKPTKPTTRRPAPKRKGRK